MSATKETLRASGYNVKIAIICGKFMGYNAIGVSPLNQIRGWHKTSEDAWEACRQDYIQTLKKRLADES